MIPNTSEDVIESHKQTKTNCTSRKNRTLQEKHKQAKSSGKQKHDQSSEEIRNTAQAKIWEKEAQQLGSTSDWLEKLVFVVK